MHWGLRSLDDKDFLPDVAWFGDYLHSMVNDPLLKGPIEVPEGVYRSLFLQEAVRHAKVVVFGMFRFPSEGVKPLGFFPGYENGSFEPLVSNVLLASMAKTFNVPYLFLSSGLGVVDVPEARRDCGTIGGPTTHHLASFLRRAEVDALSFGGVVARVPEVVGSGADIIAQAVSAPTRKSSPSRRRTSIAHVETLKSQIHRVCQTLCSPQGVFSDLHPSPHNQVINLGHSSQEWLTWLDLLIATVDMTGKKFVDPHDSMFSLLFPASGKLEPSSLVESIERFNIHPAYE